MGFPCSSAGKESTCNAGDLRLIPELGRSPEEGNSYTLQYSGLENPWTLHGIEKSQIAERLSLSHYLGWEDPLEKGMAIHSSIIAWRIPWAEEPGRL